MKGIFSSISVKHKLLTPVFLLLLVLISVIIFFFKTQSRVDDAQKTLDESRQLSDSVNQLSSSIEVFVLNRSGFADISAQLDRIVSAVAASNKSDNNFSKNLSSIEEKVNSINRLFKQNQTLSSELVAVTTASMAESNGFIRSMSGRLASETERNEVSTFERLVIAEALLHTNNSYKVQILFNQLETDLSQADELMDFITELDDASDRAIVQLEGTPMYENAMRSRRANAQVRQISETFIRNSQQIDALRRDIGETLNGMSNILSNWSVTTIDNIFAMVKASMLQIIAVVAIIVIITIILSLLLAKSITQPLTTLQHRIRELASRGGDLTFRIDAEGKDEIAELARGINRFLESLQQIFIEVSRTGEQISAHADEALTRSASSQQHIEHQQNETDKVVSSFSEMDRAIQDIAHSTANAAGKVKETDASSKEVVRSLSQTISNINSLSTSLENTTNVITQLNQDSQNIGGILDVIRGIAEQTNLLALNAAIEAARAGEQGRGFAVVADEVRSLAQRTQSSIEEINQMISKLQQASEKAKTVIEAGNQQIQTTMSSSREAEDNVNKIAALVGTISEMNMQIASAAEEQSTVAQHINLSLQEISSLAGQGSDSARKASDSASKQAESSVHLKSVISKFKI